MRYIGCIEITTSMKLLDFQSRSLVAKECIHRVCDAANLKSPKKRRVEKRVQQVIEPNPCLEHSGANVILTISSQSLELTSIDTNELVRNCHVHDFDETNFIDWFQVASHQMPNVSFASGGDSGCTDMIAYVAKDTQGWRACYVIECVGIDRAQTVISTMGKAFELRYKNFCGDDVEKRYASRRKQSSASNVKPETTEYYNDLPGKVPPEFSETSSNCDRRRERLHSNLIDLNTSIDMNDDCKNDGFNYNVATSTMSSGTSGTRDVFDMQCFSLSPEVQYSQLLVSVALFNPKRHDNVQLSSSRIGITARFPDRFRSRCWEVMETSSYASHKEAQGSTFLPVWTLVKPSICSSSTQTVAFVPRTESLRTLRIWSTITGAIVCRSSPLTPLSCFVLLS